MKTAKSEGESIAAAKGSMKTAKSEGESEQPCLVPLCRLKLGEV